ncbi:Speckle-type POZ protein [Hordeum vulgare]|nr:Speckle-type POZ protein [Hordeum vulgare]
MLTFENRVLVIMQMDKDKDVVPPLEKGKEAVPSLMDVPVQDHPNAKRVILDQGWATFVVVHHVRIRYMVTFNLLTPNTMKVIVFNDNDVEMVTKCKKHNEAFAISA